jgi:hypothetical protein
VSKKKNLEKVAEERELILEETNDFEIVIEQYVNQRSVTGVDLGYGIRNKRTGVIEMRWGAYAEALQGLMLLQESLDKFQSQFEAKQGKLH